MPRLITEDNIKPFSKENYQIFGLLLLCVFAVYYAPSFFAILVVMGITGLFIISKKDYFWLAFFLIIYFTPLAFFSEHSGSAVHRLPLFKIIPGVALSTQQIFLLAALLKAIYKKRKYVYIIQSSFIIILIYFGILIIVAVIAHDSGFDRIVDTIKAMLAYSLLFAVPMLLRDRNDVFKLLYLLFPIVLVVFLGGVYYVLAGGKYIYHIVNPIRDLQEVGFQAESSEFTGRFIPHGGQFELVIIGFVTSLFLLILKNHNKIYLYLIAISSYLIVILGSYRSWFVIFSLIFGGYILSTKNKGRNLIFFAIISLFILVLINLSDFGSSALSGAWERTLSIFTLGEKGSASTYTIENKQTYRLPQQLEYIRESPILGWGFTDKEGDGDVGNFALIVEVGFFGLILFAFLWFSYIRMIVITRMKLPKTSEYRIALSVFLYGFLGLLLSHFTTNRIFGLAASGVLLSLYFFFSDFFVKEALKTIPKTKKTKSEGDGEEEDEEDKRPWLLWWF